MEVKKEQRPNIQCICQIITVHGSSEEGSRGRIYSAFVKSQQFMEVPVQMGAEAEYTVQLSNHNSSWKFSPEGAEAEYTVHLPNHNSSWVQVRREQRPNIQCICPIITVHGKFSQKGAAEYTVHLSNHNSSWKFSQKGAEICQAEYTVHLSNSSTVPWKFSQKGAEGPNIQCICQIITSSVRREQRPNIAVHFVQIITVHEVQSEGSRGRIYSAVVKS
ncbi:unnamed protein product [Acanthosepion pharaonis]|uniref:Uncharacterized protein n=1 Tax=Acanthosepion pharaonis TaxID=158019 RepID=A0A812E991_ACAPH|nr:unnamed protein product [Sepia pharaonis]